MNPLLALLMYLRGMQGPRTPQSRQRQQGGHGPYGGIQGAVDQSMYANPNDPFGNYPWSPQSANLMNQLNMDFWNPGGGWMGSDIVGGGQAFGGIYRGPTGSYHPYQTEPNAGWTGFLSGMGPQPGQSPGQSAYNFFGPGRGDFGYPGQGTIADRPGLGEFFGNIGGMQGELQGNPELF